MLSGEAVGVALAAVCCLAGGVEESREGEVAGWRAAGETRGEEALPTDSGEA